MSTNRNEVSPILNKLQAHLEEGRRLNDEILAERDAVQAKIEQLQSYRHELDTAIQQHGIRPNDERIVHPTANPGIVKRSRQEKIDYVQSVPVEMKRKKHTMQSIANIVHEICADGKKRSKNEIFDLILQRNSTAKRGSFDAVFHTLNLSSEKDLRSAHHSARVYWLPSSNVVGERNDTAN